MAQQSITDQAKAYAQQAWAWYQNRTQQAAQQQAHITQQTAGQTVVEYKGAKAMQAGVQQMQRQGYHVASQSSYQPRIGCMRFLTLGFFSLIWKPQAKFIVTYAR